MVLYLHTRSTYVSEYTCIYTDIYYTRIYVKVPVYIYIYICIYTYCLRESILNSRHPCARRESMGVGSCGLSHTSRRLGESGGSRGLPEWFQQATFCAQAAFLGAICSQLDVVFCQKLIKCARQPKGTPMATQGVPKWSKGCPKGRKENPKSAQGETRGVQGHPKRPINHKAIYT